MRVRQTEFYRASLRMHQERKVKKERTLQTLKIVAASALILFIIGVPERRDGGSEKARKEAKLPPLIGQSEVESFPPQGVGAKKSSEEQEVFQRIQELSRMAPVKLSEEEEYQLKISNYNAYIHYRARLEDPSLLEPMTKEEIIRERIAPKLLEQLAKNRAEGSVKTP